MCVVVQLLAFEAIPELGSIFCEPIPEADDECPRMCKYQFKKSSMRGFPLSKINEELGKTQVSYPMNLNFLELFFVSNL